MRVLLDTCVLSEVQRPQGNARVRQAVEALEPDQLFLSVITIGEISNGIALLPDGRRRRELAAWLSRLERDAAEQILGIDAETAHIWGEITARAQAAGVIIPASDGLIAATALRHGLHLMTRNTRHLAASGALIIDPWA
ncbi:MAG: type II toxin-antitoxin system VapC family toxin [Sphaerobacter sp.]|nr:type II toxin-antitoxin system VapC family toxin [Sphaerobacter sp.]